MVERKRIKKLKIHSKFRSQRVSDLFRGQDFIPSNDWMKYNHVSEIGKMGKLEQIVEFFNGDIYVAKNCSQRAAWHVFSGMAGHGGFATVRMFEN